jgi:hypothetical protein
MGQYPGGGMGGGNAMGGQGPGLLRALLMRRLTQGGGPDLSKIDPNTLHAHLTALRNLRSMSPQAMQAARQSPWSGAEQGQGPFPFLGANPNPAAAVMAGMFGGGGMQGFQGNPAQAAQYATPQMHQVPGGTIPRRNPYAGGGVF